VKLGSSSETRDESVIVLQKIIPTLNRIIVTNMKEVPNCCSTFIRKVFTFTSCDVPIKYSIYSMAIAIKYGTCPQTGASYTCSVHSACDLT